MVETEGWSQTAVMEEREWSCRVNLLAGVSGAHRGGGRAYITKGTPTAMMRAMIESIHHNAHASSSLARSQRPESAQHISVTKELTTSPADAAHTQTLPY